MSISALIGAWLAGLLGGAHCLAMCGGFVAAMAGGVAAPGAARIALLLPARVLLWRQLAYNAGRITTYSLLGAAAGGSGALALSATQWLPLQRTLYVVANLFLLALALAIVWKREGFAWLQHAGIALFGRVIPIMRPLLAADSVSARYALGMIWGTVPCALTYSVLPIALFAGGALQGATVMFAFGLGTLPNLLGASWILSRARDWLAAGFVRYSAAALLGGFALVGIWRAVFGAASLGQGPFCL